MKNGEDTMQRKEDTQFKVEYRVRLKHHLDDSITYHLVLSYSTEGDMYPINEFNVGLCVTHGDTYDKACQLSKSYEQSQILDRWWLEGNVYEESWLGGVLTSLTFKNKKAVGKAAVELRKIAKSLGFKFVGETVMHSIACGVTPKLIDEETLGYEIRLSYSSDCSTQPLSLSSNVSFVSQSTHDFADLFSTEIHCPEYNAIDIIGEGFRDHALCSIECTEESLSKVLELLQKKAKYMRCKLSFIAFSGGPGWQYPKVSLCEYSVN